MNVFFTADELAEHRADAESLMTLTLAVHSPDGKEPGPDGFEVLKFKDETPTIGKVQAGSQAGGDVKDRYIRVGDVERPVLSGGLHIPIGADLPAAGEQRGIGWEYEVTAVGPYDDPALLGRRFLVVSVPAKSFATARRLNVVEVA